MKVLWFSLSPCGSIRRNKFAKYNQGWMISLEDEIKNYSNIELAVAFFSEKKEDPFVFDGVKYYPMGEDRSSNPILRIINRRRSIISIDNERQPLMEEVVNDSNPDLIHIHGTEDSFGNIAPYARRNGIPVVFSIQGMIAPYNEFMFRGIPKSIAFKHDTIRDLIHSTSIRLGAKSFKQRSSREISYLKDAEYIFGRTCWDKECTLAINPKRKYMVVNEIMRPEFYNKKWNGFHKSNDNVKSKLRLVSTISGGIYKGMETALKAAFILKSYSNIEFEWHIVGYSPNSKWVNISECASHVHARDVNMIFHGRIDAEDLSSLLVDSDIYVHVSHIENSPNSVCEAMLIGMPIVASFAGGTCSLLENRKEGILYQDGDSYSLAGAIVNLAQNPDMAIMYAHAAREKAMFRHNPKTIANELLEGYKTIINEKIY